MICIYKQAVVRCTTNPAPAATYATDLLTPVLCCHLANATDSELRPVITKNMTFNPPTRLPELTHNWIRSFHGYSTPSLKISCKSVQPFSRDVADKETNKQRNKARKTERKKEVARKQYPVPLPGGGGNKYNECVNRSATSLTEVALARNILHTSCDTWTHNAQASWRASHARFTRTIYLFIVTADNGLQVRSISLHRKTNIQAKIRPTWLVLGNRDVNHCIKVQLAEYRQSCARYFVNLFVRPAGGHSSLVWLRTVEASVIRL